MRTAGGMMFDVTVVDGLQDIVRLTATTAAVPLPPALWLMAAACASLAGLRRRAA